MTNEDLMRLSCKGVVSVGIRINNCIKNYQSGILYDGDGSCGCSQPQSTNHAAAIVGFGRDHKNEVCKDYWIVKNSWGPKWGENGFFRLCREDAEMEYGTCNIRMNPMIALKY
jgi:C1A family cysteine protease